MRLSHPRNYEEEVMEKIEYFDYQKVARETKIPNNILKDIKREVKKEFPNDKMMYELHVLRAIKSRYWQKTQAQSLEAVK